MGYSKKDVIAVIISCNPTNVLLHNVESLENQVDAVYILDNNSSEKGRCVLSDIERNRKCEIIYHPSNEGIPLRLNEGIRIAVNNQYPLMLTMDQDTILDKNCVSEMLSVLNMDPLVASVGPKRINRHMSKSYYYKDYLITSGNLVKVDSLTKACGYWEKLFIDLVDTEISLRLRECGNKLAIANKAKMDHKVGDKEENMIMGLKYEYYSHNAKRYYYVFRNLCVIEKTYFKKYPFFCIKLLITHVIIFLRIFIEKDKGEKYKSAIHGFLEGQGFEKRPEITEWC